MVHSPSKKLGTQQTCWTIDSINQVWLINMSENGLYISVRTIMASWINEMIANTEIFGNDHITGLNKNAKGILLYEQDGDKYLLEFAKMEITLQALRKLRMSR